MNKMTEKQICLEIILPTLVIAICKDALLINKGKAGEPFELLRDKSYEYFFSLVKTNKLIRRLERCCNAILREFVCKSDGTYTMRKVVLAMHPLTQHLHDRDLVSRKGAELVQDLLVIEGDSELAKNDWLKIKASADKKVEDLIKIIEAI